MGSKRVRLNLVTEHAGTHTRTDTHTDSDTHTHTLNAVAQSMGFGVRTVLRSNLRLSHLLTESVVKLVNSLLTGGFLQKLSPMTVFILAGPQINSVISLTLCRLLHSIVIPDTPVKPSNFHEMLSSTKAKD